ncbi:TOPOISOMERASE IV SUBUNIT B [Mycoplasmopsis pulmonis]|uniref:DNA topoisomerase (ATP-hydrolyzing) n=1 Tax=Mycoplasmopsis pulmonis (strain UAB CTIP) TaxID=272635 RepID=Q98QI9_MYCPU|nr:DNA topoisomerase IV subunit B [Mycoplasmopsis pulmonis]MDZ7293326.1 DNA topoisomerase IV subunit B [Mycoplasmopsis pulmonis]CAC13545.1 TOPOISOMERASE IV SUBUNIT B [Mycoplasmopsis pulmonis]
MSKYTVDDLKMLKGLEAVRKRPGMYIGSTDINGLHHLVWEIFDNAVDEALAGYASIIKVSLTKNQSIRVEDNGRGIPVEKHSSGKSGVELVFTELHAGGKFSEGAYRTSGGLHGVGSSVVNALSKELTVSVFKDGFEYRTKFENGDTIVEKTHKVGPSNKKGTIVEFLPNYEIFKRAQFLPETISERLREASFLIPNLKIVFYDENQNLRETFNYENGIEAFVDFINNGKKTLNKVVSFSETKKNIELSCAFQYNDDYSETIISFVNNVKTRDGGTHEAAFKSAFTKTLNDYAIEKKILKGGKTFEGSDFREGLTAIISLKIPESILEFVGQTKDKLGTIEAKNVVEEIVSQNLKYWLNEKKQEAEKVFNKFKKAYEARIAARKARNEARTLKSKMKETKILSGKLTPAQSKNPKENEIFLVEGDSAGGSAKSGRNRRFQAILPLRGKVINTEKSRLIDILKNEEISTIINALNTGVGEDFEIKNLKYHKIIIMTDADTDGAHIQVLLLTFFFRYMHELIEKGMVYVALPPLFKVTFKNDKKNKIAYAWDENELKEIVKNKSVEIQRYKGLGEMNADQLWETTMNPETRSLVKITIQDAAIVERRVSTLMGENVEIRKEWINKNVKFTLEDDFQISTGELSE